MPRQVYTFILTIPKFSYCLVMVTNEGSITWKCFKGEVFDRISPFI